MSSILITVAIIVISLIFKAQKAKKEREGVSNGHQGENFPFPKPKSAEREREIAEWLGIELEEEEPQPVIAIQTPHQKLINKEGQSAFTKKIAHVDTKPKQVFEHDFEFDAEKAIIYSEILKPKYLDYEQN